jgi:4-hydroxybutyryl-CoA dehydratase/vinylacetyl-CoA-Delta-isomerase
MGIMTKEQYMESLKVMDPVVYVGGEKLEKAAFSPYLRTSLNNMCLGYDWSNDPKYADLVTFNSDLIGEKVSFWTNIMRSNDDLHQLVKIVNTISSRYLCAMCMITGQATMWAATWDIDKAHGTNYHERFKEFYKDVQRKDQRFTMGVMDPKGDRRLPPHKQENPEVFLRVVEKREDGIVVRGAKAHTTSAPITHWFLATPSRALGKEDGDCAVSFACPVDAKGLSFIMRPAAGPLEQKDMESPISGKIGFVECLSVFDDVFVPWDHVFMCGEWEQTENFIQYFSANVRIAKGTCVAARTEMIAGITAAVADYNGIAGAGHVRNKITDMIIDSQIGYGCATAAATLGKMHPSGICFPDTIVGNAGLYNTRLRYIQHLGVMHEIAGGIVTTMPCEKDFKSEKVGKIVERLLIGKNGTSAEERYRMLHVVQDLTASHMAGYMMSNAICAGGTPETNRVEVTRNYDIMKRCQQAKVLAKIQDDPDGYWHNLK